MDARDPRVRHRHHAERIGVAQVGLGRKGEPGEIAQAAAVDRIDAGGVPLGAVGGNVVVGVAQGLLEAAELESFDFVA